MNKTNEVSVYEAITEMLSTQVQCVLATVASCLTLPFFSEEVANVTTA